MVLAGTPPSVGECCPLLVTVAVEVASAHPLEGWCPQFSTAIVVVVGTLPSVGSCCVTATAEVSGAFPSVGRSLPETLAVELAGARPSVSGRWWLATMTVEVACALASVGRYLQLLTVTL